MIRLTIGQSEQEEHVQSVQLLLDEMEEADPSGEEINPKELLSAPNGVVFIARDENDRALGMVAASLEDDCSADVGCFYVRPDAPLRTARFMLKATYCWLRTVGAQHVAISVTPRNRNRRYYRRMGFRYAGKIPCFSILRASIEKIGRTLDPHGEYSDN